MSVYTRTDLWRLVAHALVTIDLAPGPIVARECVESLRFGTPIVVPVGSAAQPHADTGAGLSFTGYAELLACVARPRRRRPRSDCHNGVASTPTCADGDPDAFVDSVAHVLGFPVVSSRADGRADDSP